MLVMIFIDTAKEAKERISRTMMNEAPQVVLNIAGYQRYQIIIMLLIMVVGIISIVFLHRLYLLMKNKYQINSNMGEDIRSIKSLEQYNVEINKMQFELIRSLVELIEMKDEYTAGHSQRVTDYAVELGKSLGYDDRQIEILRYSSILHDIGKIGIPEEILNKPGKLDESELNRIKEHPYTGYQAISNIDFLKEEAEVILYHHERVDGRGYPYGLKGDELNEMSKILSICDSYDAMTTDRTYKIKMSKLEAVMELRRNAGTQFDSELVEKFIDYLESSEEEAS